MLGSTVQLESPPYDPRIPAIAARWYPFPSNGNNQRENDIRANVRRRKISGGTHSDTGRKCREAFLTLMKTCQCHTISFWDYLGDRLDVPGAKPVPHLPALARQMAQPQTAQ